MRIKKWLFCTPCNLYKSGLWPFNLWFYSHKEWYVTVYGVGFHWLWIADAHFEIYYYSQH